MAVVVIGVIVAGAFLWESFSKTHRLSSAKTSAAIAWRIKIFGLKAEGRIPELSWSELWQMTRHQGGFGLEAVVAGRDIHSSINNPYVTDADLQAASIIFNTRCAMCHDSDGGGGHGGPPLNHPGLKHGDNDLAIYEVLRDGVADTAMRPPSVSMEQRWQLVGYVKHLQLHEVGLGLGKAPLNIEVSQDQVLSAGSKADEWLTYSGSLDGQRYTPLKQITPANVAQLRIRWVRQFETNLRTIEATPIVADGVIFTTEPPSDSIAVDALDAKSGDLLWRYTRNIPDGVHACCGRYNKGLAILDNHLYLASLEGYLVCINADTGKQVWETQVADFSRGYSLNMAPLITNGSVVVGVAGAEQGIRGFLAAYDAETGEKQWQFYTIPGPGESGHETWGGDDSWQTGGGSTWATGSYDPSLKLVYWGVANPSEDLSGHDHPGDNLYSDSVVALHADTGKLAWYFQFTPHDVHDWDSAQTPILADISIHGKSRKVICWANRNGFYYVLDRATGEFIAGVPFVKVNWTKGLDAAGRPIPPNEVVSNAAILPANSQGATLFQNPAFDPQKGLIFVPATDRASTSTPSPHMAREDQGLFEDFQGDYVEPPIPVVRALDVATGIKKWEHFSPPIQGTFYYSGLLATGGGLVFGGSGGFVFALDSATGHELWRFYLGGDTRATPISFTVDGRQVIAVSAGRGLFLFEL
ncbi:MAG: PQQ-binding-like beta-propeller repeat protein [Candidatus Acidiferrales bacterium]